MKRNLLLGYQIVAGLSDTSTGLMLILVPGFTLRWMGLHVAADALPFLSYIGAFVLSVGTGCFYGAWVATRGNYAEKLAVVWVLTGMTRTAVAIFLVAQVLLGGLPAGWLTVAATDGIFAGVQFFGLRKGWLAHG